tara:strand:+ start:81 stop:500 length:420 start_codon:yes stop_codon:yes gene_type:complete
MSRVIISDNLHQLADIAKNILEYTSPNKKFLFYADMGVGKTTLIKELSLQLGAIDIISSPTFSIVNEYTTLNNYKIYHFDFYRLEDEKEAFDFGYEEYFNSNDYCFVEWPEKISALRNEETVSVKMCLDGNKRIIEIIV